MTWQRAFTQRVQAFRLPPWEEIPDLGLYMDQVITWLERLYRPLYGDRRIITPSMINNYVKAGLVLRPKAKKYDRGQLAQLTMLCGLKQAVSLEALGTLLRPPEGGSIEETYQTFLNEIDAAGQQISSALPSFTAMQCAVTGAVYTLLCGEAMQRSDP